MIAGRELWGILQRTKNENDDEADKKCLLVDCSLLMSGGG